MQAWEPPKLVYIEQLINADSGASKAANEKTAFKLYSPSGSFAP